MPRMIRTARGEVVDFDAILIKHELAKAPMNIEVERRKNFINGEGKIHQSAFISDKPIHVVSDVLNPPEPSDDKVSSPVAPKEPKKKEST